MTEKILVLEDEEDIANIIKLYLEQEGYIVTICDLVEQAKAQINQIEFDIAILDVMLPDGSGFELCQYIRNSYNYPVIMLTAKASELDKITGLTLGADDYITKPFLPLELVARVKAQIRRYKTYNNDKQKSSAIYHKGLVIDKEEYSCKLNEREIKLTKTEFEILYTLASNLGKTFTQEELLEVLWQNEVYDKNNNTISVHIRHIRQKMNDSFEKPKYIKTVWGVGYKIEK